MAYIKLKSLNKCRYNVLINEKLFSLMHGLFIFMHVEMLAFKRVASLSLACILLIYIHILCVVLI